ncbi:MAG TPA: RNA 2',3'-cyclic phosphodiesterase [Nitrososphaerales archaeon]|nr:RNA 2',3'-cyclic phosphodiesterase [Nitrososphaerales archaeon]
MAEFVRAFVALEVSGDVTDSLVQAQRELEVTGADIKLVERENLHLNLKFLGEISEAQVSEAKSRLARLSLKGAGARIRGIGAFPAPSRPRVVWAGVAPEDESLVVQIAKGVIAALEGIGERDDRPFTPHITLGRVRSGRNLRELVEVLRRNAGRDFGAAKLSEVKLKSSTLTGSGPVYRDEGVYPLS